MYINTKLNHPAVHLKPTHLCQLYFKKFLNKKYDSLINISKWINRNFALLPSEFSMLIYYETNGLPGLRVLCNHTDYPTAPPSPQPPVQWSVLYFYNVVNLRFFSIESYVIFGGFFKLNIILWKFIQVAVCNNYSFFLTTEHCSMVRMYYCLYNQSPVEGIWVVSSLGLVQIKLLCALMGKDLCECKSSFLWHQCPGVQSLNHKVVACLVSRSAMSFYIHSHQQRVCDPVFLYPGQRLVLVVV